MRTEPKDRTETVQYEYMYRYTPSYIHINTLYINIFNI